MNTLRYTLLLLILMSIFTNCQVRSMVKDKYACVPVKNKNFEKSYKILQTEEVEYELKKLVFKETRDLRCMTSEQIKEFMILLGYDHNRLDYAKYALGFCSNSTEYYETISPHLGYRSMKRELRDLMR
ncbi:MAG: DUF4476 domain-containing protein [Saprospiraceae bacterium]